MPPTVLGVYVGTRSTNYDIGISYPRQLCGDDLPCMASPDLFFPSNYGLQCHRQIAEAKAACNQCPIQLSCLAWAVDKPDLDGIWGAATPPERQRMRRRRPA